MPTLGAGQRHVATSCAVCTVACTSAGRAGRGSHKATGMTAQHDSLTLPAAVHWSHKKAAALNLQYDCRLQQHPSSQLLPTIPAAAAAEALAAAAAASGVLPAGRFFGRCCACCLCCACFCVRSSSSSRRTAAAGLPSSSSHMASDSATSSSLCKMPGRKQDGPPDLVAGPSVPNWQASCNESSWPVTSFCTGGLGRTVRDPPLLSRSACAHRTVPAHLANRGEEAQSGANQQRPPLCKAGDQVGQRSALQGMGSIVGCHVSG